MQITFYLEAGCIGPEGKTFLKLFCRAFKRHLAQQPQLAGFTIQVLPRPKHADEIQYFNPSQPEQRCNDAEIDAHLARLHLNRDELEQSLIDLATDYEASSEWQMLKEHFSASADN